jgi:hypothetical protein
MRESTVSPRFLLQKLDQGLHFYVIQTERNVLPSLKKYSANPVYMEINLVHTETKLKQIKMIKPFSSYTDMPTSKNITIIYRYSSSPQTQYKQKESFLESSSY